MLTWRISAFSVKSVTRLGGPELLVEHAAELAWCHWLMRYAKAVCCDHALELQMPCAEIYTAYRERPAGSASKLRTLPDGIRIAWLILRLVKDERPLAFFTLLGALCVVASLALGIPLVREFVDTGLVPKLPSAVLAASLMVLGALNLTAGLILDLITKTRREVKRLAYLSVRLPQWM